MRKVIPFMCCVFFTAVTKAQDTAYDRSQFKIWVCKSVDETNWKPVGVTTHIPAGGCITFFFESAYKIKNPGFMRWKIYRAENGKEVFINQRDQETVLPEWRRMYYEECDEFRTKGKYVVYFAVRNESEAYYGVQDAGYFAKGEVTVD